MKKTLLVLLIFFLQGCSYLLEYPTIYNYTCSSLKNDYKNEDLTPEYNKIRRLYIDNDYSKKDCDVYCMKNYARSDHWDEVSFSGKSIDKNTEVKNSFTIYKDYNLSNCESFKDNEFKDSRGKFCMVSRPGIVEEPMVKILTYTKDIGNKTTKNSIYTFVGKRLYEEKETAKIYENIEIRGDCKG